MGAIGAILAIAAIGAPWIHVTTSDSRGSFAYTETPKYIWDAQWATFGSGMAYPTPRPDLYEPGIYIMFLGILVLAAGSIVAFVSKFGGFIMLTGMSASTIGVASASGTYVFADWVLTIGPSWGLLVAWLGVGIAVVSYYVKDSPDGLSFESVDETRLARGLRTQR